jgi:hypothetical protein
MSNVSTDAIVAKAIVRVAQFAETSGRWIVFSPDGQHRVDVNNPYAAALALQLGGVTASKWRLVAPDGAAFEAHTLGALVGNVGYALQALEVPELLSDFPESDDGPCLFCKAESGHLEGCPASVPPVADLFSLRNKVL